MLPPEIPPDLYIIQLRVIMYLIRPIVEHVGVYIDRPVPEELCPFIKLFQPLIHLLP